MPESLAQFQRSKLLGAAIAPSVAVAARVWAYPTQDVVNPTFSRLELPFGLPGDPTANALVPCQDGEGMILRITENGEKSATLLTKDDFDCLMGNLDVACTEAYGRSFLSGCVAYLSGKFHPSKLWIEQFNEWVGELDAHVPDYERFGC